MRLKLQGGPKVLHWRDADRLKTMDSVTVKLHLTGSPSPICSRISAVHKANPAPWLSIALSASHPDSAEGLGRGWPRRPRGEPLVARAQRALRAQSASLPAGEAQGPPRPPLLLLLLPPWAGCGRERRRGQAARRPSHGAILTRAASPRAPSADFRNQKAISSSPGKGTMRLLGRESRGANA